MTEAELKENIEKIKQLLTLPDYDKIDAGIELAVSLEEPKIFEALLKDCKLDKFDSRPVLNEWLKKTIIEESKLNEYPTGYYVLLALLLNAPIKSTSTLSISMYNILLSNWIIGVFFLLFSFLLKKLSMLESNSHREYPFPVRMTFWTFQFSFIL